MPKLNPIHPPGAEINPAGTTVAVQILVVRIAMRIIVGKVFAPSAPEYIKGQIACPSLAHFRANLYLFPIPDFFLLALSKRGQMPV